MKKAMIAVLSICLLAGCSGLRIGPMGHQGAKIIYVTNAEDAAGKGPISEDVGGFWRNHWGKTLVSVIAVGTVAAIGEHNDWWHGGQKITKEVHEATPPAPKLPPGNSGNVFMLYNSSGTFYVDNGDLTDN